MRLTFVTHSWCRLMRHMGRRWHRSTGHTAIFFAILPRRSTWHLLIDVLAGAKPEVIASMANKDGFR